MKPKKKNDILSILVSRFGEDWSKRDIGKFYESVLSMEPDELAEETEDEDEDNPFEICDCLDDEPCYH